MKIEPLIPIAKSLAQILYETNPVIGWSPQWAQLDAVQRRWWINYEATARTFILREADIRDVKI